MTMKVRDVVRRLRKDGWTLARISGSHHQYMHPMKPGIVTIAFSQEGDDVGGKTLDSIFKQAGWK